MKPDMVKGIVEQHGPTSVRAHEFFVSWNSVATLAYRGFSNTLLAVKRELDQGIPGLKPENPGSKWPKTTLGCLGEQVTLTEAQVRVLRGICDQMTSVLRKLPESDVIMPIDELAIVTFHCRTLERRLGAQTLLLKGKWIADDDPPKSHVEAVTSTMAQFAEAQHAKYFPKLAPAGRTIDSYYRTPHIESTLVYNLKPSKPFKDILKDFEDVVDNAIPNSYVWFEPASWHMTVRALLSLD